MQACLVVASGLQHLVFSNPTLTSVEKLQYLKTSLVGSAALLIKNTALTADNFQKSWDALIAFYENKRLLVNATLHSLTTLKRMTKESASELEQLYSNIMQLYRTLDTLQRPVAYWDDVFVFIAVQRLDSETVKAWEHHVGSSKEPPTWEELSTFLVSRMLSLQAYERSKTGKPGKENQPRAVKAHYQGKASKTATSEADESISCTFCKSKHRNTRCPSYNAKTVAQRRDLIIKHKLCFNCLKPHRSIVCKSINRCLKCSRKHHTSLHDKSVSSATPGIAKSDTAPASTVSATSQVNNQVMHVAFNQGLRQPSILLATASVLISSPSGESSPARILIDQGAEISLISERLVQRLRLPRTRVTIPLIGIGGHRSNTTNGSTSVRLQSRHGSPFTLSVNAHILPRLTASLPSMRSTRKSWPHLNGLSFADPDFLTPSAIDLILGADYYSQILQSGLVKGPVGTPMAQSTKFGWIISGPVDSTASLTTAQEYHVSCDDQLYTLIQRFWELDAVPAWPNAPLSTDDQECEDHFVRTHTRDPHGRYVVRLPFKLPPDYIGNSKEKALRIIIRLSKSLATDSLYSRSYSDFINEYEQLGHMVRVRDDTTVPSNAYYLPHHGVWKKNNPTSKLRVVFNGSSRTTSGKSLNDVLHVGEKLQVDLFNVLVWFRRSCYVFSADVEKMYRQILVHPEDQKFQRILWIDQFQNVLTYQLTTVTYGLACAPFLALRTFLQLVTDEGARFPHAVPALTKGRYVDDVFGGSDTIEYASLAATQLLQLCTAGGFELRKWVSNHPAILTGIPPDYQLSAPAIPINDDTFVHTLGLSWQPVSDTFHFTFELPPSTVITKRSVMSTLAKLFDPLGLVSPVLITGKILIQELWILKLDWDEPLPSQISSRWTDFLHSLQELSQLAFPRWIGYRSDARVELHGFCDQLALAAVIYLRSFDTSENISLSMICSKTKVAPLKKQTIPRLELSAAVLLTRLTSHILKVLELQTAPVFLWTDSSITHVWVNNHPSRWKEFVRNRVCFIHETLPQAQWKFVPGSDNPADMATRGLSSAQLSGMTTWWKGPSWLSQDSTTWPRTPDCSSSSKILEERPPLVCAVTVPSTQPWDLLHRYSDLTRLLRITAWCQRAICRFKHVNKVSVDIPLTPQELDTARNWWVKNVQRSAFVHELQAINNNQSLSRSNSLVRLTPFVDTDGLLRVGGRLQKSLLPADTIHPLILPKMSPFTNLLIRDAHLRTMHGGTQVTMAYLRRKFWIIGRRVPIRSFILKCVICARFRHQRAQQLMGQLPVTRISPSRPFENTGLDYAGPFTVKTWRGRNARTYKGYIAVFICLSTSAVHIELVTDYSTDAFLAAYKRFTARRGKCATLSSDCGTNFKGGDAELKRLFTAASSESTQLASLLANDGTL